MSEGAQAAVAARIRGAETLGLVPPPGADALPATSLADPQWTAQRLTERARQQHCPDRRVVATVWWYSVSTVLVTPPLAGLVTGIGLSARLEDTAVSFRSGLPVAAVASAGGHDPSGDLRNSLAAVVAAVAEAGDVRELPLWAIATDSLANQLLALGRAIGDVPAVTAVAGPLAAAIGPPLPAPRYVDVAAARFVHRVSCCLVLELPGQPMCTSCPRRAPAERLAMLESAARWF